MTTQTVTKSLLTGGTFRAVIPILLLLGLVILIGALQPSFLTVDTLLVVMADTATLFILAAGITFVVILGGIDLSIQAVASLSSVIVAVTLSRFGYWAFPGTLLVGFITGAFSGVVHVWLRIPSFIVTLATSGLVAAAALLLSQGTLDHHWRVRARVPELDHRTPVWDAECNINWRTGGLCGDLVAALHAVWPLQHRHRRRRGRDLGIGCKSESAKGNCLFPIGRFGVPAGILLTGRLSSGSPTLANELLLPAIAAVVVGGTSITGGAGGIGRTVIGALIISVVRVGMTFVGVDIFAQQIVFGVVLILAVAVTIDRTKILIVK